MANKIVKNPIISIELEGGHAFRDSSNEAFKVRVQIQTGKNYTSLETPALFDKEYATKIKKNLEEAFGIETEVRFANIKTAKKYVILPKGLKTSRT